MLEEFATSLYKAEGPTVPFFGFPYPTRMAIAKLPDDELWIWSPIQLTEDLATEVQSLGEVRYIVSPNKIHHLFLTEWINRWPKAQLYAPPGLTQKRPDLHFDAELDDNPNPEWAKEIDQTIFHGSFLMEEVAFFHHASKTAIIGDLIQRHPESKMSGWKGLIMRLDGLVGEEGSTPREWRASFLNRKRARAARKRVLDWNAQKLLIAHGECVHTNAAEVISKALSWI